MKKLTIPAFLIILCLIPATASSQMFSLWGDELMSDCDVSVGQFETYTIYVFLDPGPDGAFAAEYKLELPDSHVCISSEQNTFISGAVIGLPTGPPGVQAPFLSCQNSDVWLYKHTIIVLGERAQHLITLAPHDDTQFMGIATCPGTRPLVDCSVYIHFGVNISCANPCWWPWLPC